MTAYELMFSMLLFFCQPGETLPDVTVYEGTPDKEVNIADLFRGKKGVLFSVPGAFNPSCSKVSPGH